MLKKFNYVFPLMLSQVFGLLIESIIIQNYTSKNYSFVDFFIKVKNKNLIKWSKLLKTSLLLNYDQLSNLTCIDNLNLKKKIKRFSLVYIFTKINTASRLIVLTHTTADNFVSSITPIYKSANWLEREIFDLFGLWFKNHKDLRRILTDYGFKGFPLRKDFPLSGYLELRYNEDLKYAKYQQLLLMQEYRVFNLFSSWEQYKIKRK